MQAQSPPAEFRGGVDSDKGEEIAKCENEEFRLQTGRKKQTSKGNETSPKSGPVVIRLMNGILLPKPLSRCAALTDFIWHVEE